MRLDCYQIAMQAGDTEVAEGILEALHAGMAAYILGLWDNEISYKKLSEVFGYSETTVERAIREHVRHDYPFGQLMPSTVKGKAWLD